MNRFSLVQCFASKGEEVEQEQTASSHLEQVCITLRNLNRSLRSKLV